MNGQLADRERIKDYLLGQTSEQDEFHFETRLLSDLQFYDELSIVEDELIEEYLDGELSDKDRHSFESHFVASIERKKKVRFAKALRRHAFADAAPPLGNTSRDEVVSDATFESKSDRSSTPLVFPVARRPVFYAIAALILVALIGTAIILLRNRQASPFNGRMLAVELSPAPVTRGDSELNQVRLAPDIGNVQFQLDLSKNEYQSYEAVLRDSSLRNLLTTGGLKPQHRDNIDVVIVDVKANLLLAGDYRLLLNGLTAGGGSETIATYSFTVQK